ncbi:farnesyl pyrophosphate synthase 1-like isoform X1 [Silene latifolia]|uniref:farnesyl pyrophosphate synthase 1-like isoform X1 n=1 Tax=Silene latifolia TaxID=37657 RepID=UPI003D78AF77
MEGKRREEEIRERFLKVYEQLKSEVLQDPAFEYCPVSSHWLQQMLDYNVPGGKLSRGLSVVETFRLLKQEEELSETHFFLASVLGWCIQWFVACALMLDDVLDNSVVRRGRTCWFRLPNVGMIAINDVILLWNHINRILRNHFRNQPYYADLLDLFNEVEFQTTSGEMLDLLTTVEGAKDLSKFTLEQQQRISRFKTAYGTFYLPLSCALLMLGQKLDDYTNVKDILLDMGIYFQVQDDYLDCFGDPEKVGKIGSDIRDFKCSWLVVKAMELCNEEQKKLLCDNYGKEDSTNVDIVKSLYNDLNLQGVFAEYEIEVYEKLMNRIETIPSESVQSVLKSFLSKIYRRNK